MIVMRTPKGWTGPSRGGRPTGGGHLAGPPGAAGQGPHQPGAPAPAAGVDAVLPASRAVRHRRAAPPRDPRVRPARRAPDGQQSARQRRPAAARPVHARLPAVRGAGRRAGRDGIRAHPGTRQAAPRRHAGQPGRGQLPGGRPGRDGLQPARSDLRGQRQDLGRGHAAGGREPGPGRPGDGDPVRAHLPGLAGGLPADRPARLVLLLRGVHPHRRLDVQPARQVAEDHPRRCPGGGRSPRSTTCSPRTCGGRTTTGSATRTRASSTTW